MISNQILQSTLDGLKGISRMDLCVMDIDGKEVASTVSMDGCSQIAADFANDIFSGLSAGTLNIEVQEVNGFGDAYQKARTSRRLRSAVANTIA